MIYKYHCGTERHALEDKPSTLIHPAAPPPPQIDLFPLELIIAFPDDTDAAAAAAATAAKTDFLSNLQKVCRKLEIISGDESQNQEAWCCAHASPIAIFKSSHNAPLCVSGM